MKYAIISHSGKQYKIKETDSILLDFKKNLNKGDSIELTDVLMVRDGEKVEVGTPYLRNWKVQAEVIDSVKGEKIDVSKFKSKVNYRRHIGFRAKFTKVIIKLINENTVEKKPGKKLSSKLK